MKKQKGCLEVICGSMFSGKSEELIRRLQRAKIAQQNVCAFKHSFDTQRADHDFVVSHNGNKINAIPIGTIQPLTSIKKEPIDVVGIDEIQFFSHDIIVAIYDLIESGKRVIVAGLDLDFKRVPFGPMPTLLALADKVTKLKAICITCGTDAQFTQRLVNGLPAKYHDPLVLIGASESYQARCRNCFVIDKDPQLTW